MHAAEGFPCKGKAGPRMQRQHHQQTWRVQKMIISWCVCVYDGEGGSENLRKLGEKNRQIPGYKGLYILNILYKDFF